MTTTYTSCTYAEAHQAGYDLAESVPDFLRTSLSAHQVAAAARAWAKEVNLASEHGLMVYVAALTRASELGHADVAADAAVGIPTR